ncbi:hypothetical protein ACGFYE_34665 [Streptomyces zaomyceticus]|uniref:hypothetical protein n=1 Tax=Streptomyces zaomyceticus TaxID=68286 RepID=UPI00371FE5E9
MRNDDASCRQAPQAETSPGGIRVLAADTACKAVVVTETTPYDADRGLFTRQALARLVLCDHAADVADGAAGLVATANDPDTGLGGRVSQAVQLVELAERALASAVIYERERGSSWAEIAQYLGIGPAEAEERFAANLDGWNTAFDIPYRLDDTGRKRVPQLPTAAYDPAWACDRLDTWAGNRLVLVDDERPVSSGLVMAAPEAGDPAAGTAAPTGTHLRSPAQDKAAP